MRNEANAICNVRVEKIKGFLFQCYVSHGIEGRFDESTFYAFNYYWIGGFHQTLDTNYRDNNDE